MGHTSEEQFSAYIDNQLSGEEKRRIEEHLRSCALCGALYSEMLELTRLFRDLQPVEPSPFLWNRIEAGMDDLRASRPGWIISMSARLRQYCMKPGFAAAALVILVAVALLMFRGSTRDFSDRAALAEIDRTQRSLAAYDPEVYNPFRSALPNELDANPFRSLRISGTMDKTTTAPRH
jgi:anti-sigma factor RsiW